MILIKVHKRFFIPTALVGALALAAVVGMACGSDDGGTAGEGDQLTIGSLIPFTGSLSYFGEPLSNAFNLAITHVNDAGGVNGANVATQHRDTAVSPVQGVDSARALVDVDGASAIVGALSSGVTLAVAESVTVPKGILQISAASTSPAITVLEDNDFLFRTTVSDAAQGVVLARLAMEQGYDSAGILYINNAYGEGLANQFTETFTSLGGTVTASVPHEETQPTYTSELQKATAGEPDVLISMSYPGQAEVYLREALEGDYADEFLFADAGKSPEMMDVVGWDAMEGMLGTAAGAADNPFIQQFHQSYLDTYGEEITVPYLAEIYDAAVLIALAAEMAGSTDPALIRDALRSVANPQGEIVGPGPEGVARALELIRDGQDVNYRGAAGEIDFDANGDVLGTIEIWKVEGGEIKSTGRFELP